MSNQLQITGGAKVRNLEGVITGTSGVLNALSINTANGIPQLDSNGKILVSQLPNSVMEFLGVWNASTNTPYLHDGTGNAGDVYLCNVAGTVDFGSGPITFSVGDYVVYTGSVWARSSGATGTVTSVAISESSAALSITGSPITTSGTINIGFAGTSAQYVAGDGSLITFPSLSGYVPYTGATNNLDLGGHIFSNQASGTSDRFLYTGYQYGSTNLLFSLGQTSTNSGYLSLYDSTGTLTTLLNGAGNSFLVTGHPLLINTYDDNGSGAYLQVNGGITGTTGNFTGQLTLGSTITNGTYTYTLPSATGTLALTSSLGGYVPYTGATQTLDMGAWDVNARGIKINGTGGLGHIDYKHQSGTPTGSASSSTLYADTNGDLAWLNDHSYTMTLSAHANTANRVYTFPDASGTLALTSDISYPVTSVFGRTGAVTAQSGDYTTTQVTEGTNLYFTNTRARGAISLTTTGTSGVATYNSTTGVINIPNYSESTFGTVTSVGLSAPTGFSVSGSPVTSSGTLALSFASGYSLPTTASQTNWDTAYTNRITTANSPLSIASNAISISQATTSTNGYLSSTDWNTFNGKQSQINGTGFVKASGTTISYDNSTYVTTNTTQTISGTKTFTAINEFNAQQDFNGAIYLNSALNLVFGAISSVGGGTFGLYSNKSGTASSLFLLDGDTGFYNKLSFNNASNKTFTFPNTSGTIALTSDIPSLTGYIQGSGTTNYMPKFTASGTIGNSIVSESGSVISVAGSITTSGGFKFTGASWTNQASVGGIDYASGVRFYSLGANTTTKSGFEWHTNSSDGSIDVTAMRLDASGNLGLGVTPSAWLSAFKTLQISNRLSLSGTSASVYLGNNWFVNTSGSNRYIETDFATLYGQDNGIHAWYTAPSGTAGAAISFTTAMTLFSTGNLTLGTNQVDSGYKFYLRATQGMLIQAGTSSSNNSFAVDNSTGSTNYFTIRGDGAATFSSSVTANSGVIDTGGLNIKGTGATAKPDMLRLSNASAGGYYWDIWRDNTTGYLNFGAATGGGLSTFLTIKDVSGNVGIGTTSPSTFLHIVGSNTSGRGQLSIQSNNSSNAAKATWYYDTTNQGEIGTTSSDFYALAVNNFLFYAGGSERMRITSGGKVQINSPSDTGPRLSILGTANDWTIGAAGSSTTGQSYGILITAGTNSSDYGFYVQNQAQTSVNFVVRGDGRVGIGTSIPSSLLHVNGGDIIISNSTQQSLIFQTSGASKWNIANSTSGLYLQFYNYTTSNVALAIANSSGNVLINTTTDSGYKLNVNGSASFGSVYIGSLSTGLVYSNSGTLTSTNPSDLRLKNTINTLNYGLNEVLQLKPKTFYYNDDTKKSNLKYGFIAQEVQEVMPDLVKNLEDSDYLGLNTEAINVILVNAVKQLKAEIDELKLKIK